jgi:hypothetical protein
MDEIRQTLGMFGPLSMGFETYYGYKLRCKS